MNNRSQIARLLGIEPPTDYCSALSEPQIATLCATEAAHAIRDTLRRIGKPTSASLLKLVIEELQAAID